MRKNPNATENEINEKLVDSKKNIEPLLAKSEARKELEDKAKEIKRRAQDPSDLGGYLTENDKKSLTDSANEALKFLADSPDASKKDIEEKMKKNGWYM